jgi:hypothetical protein
LVALQVEEMKKEHERREWMQLQQQQLLEAKSDSYVLVSDMVVCTV